MTDLGLKDSFAKWIGEGVAYFIPFWMHLVSTLGEEVGANLRRTYSEPSLDPSWPRRGGRLKSC
jgi:hypothetical protein